MSQKNKISVMHITYDMRIGGTEMVIKNIIDGADSKLFDMSIFCIEEPLGLWGKELQKEGLQISTKARTPGFDILLIFAIRKHINKYKINVLHCHQYTPYVYGLLATIGTKTKVIFTEHGRFYPDSSSWKRKLLNPIFNKFTAHVTAISEATKQALVTYENFPEKDIRVIYNGIQGLSMPKEDELKLLKHKLGFTDKDRIVGTISRFDPIKNHLMMIRAFNDCLKTEPNLKLLIVGDGETRTQIESEVTKLNIQDKVILTGYQTNPLQYLAIMEIFLLSSFSEGTSMTLLEAMSLGKPCVVTDAGGNKEVIKNEYNGIVTENDNHLQFSKAIQDLQANVTLFDQYSTASKIRFSELFNVTAMSQNFIKLYQNSNPS